MCEVAYHRLKILPQYFEEVWDGKKTFELRKDDRNYAVGDTLALCEYKDGKFTGSEIQVTVTHILRNCKEYGLADGYCILSIKRHFDLMAQKDWERIRKNARRI